MKNVNLINKISLFVTFVFLGLLAAITADVTVTYIDKNIKIPLKKEKKVSRLKESEEMKAALTDYKELFELNVFKAAVKNKDFLTGKKSVPISTDDFTAEPPPKEEAPYFNTAEYQLYGTMVATPKEFSSATIYNTKEKKHEIYGLKEYNRFIDGTFEIVAINRGSIEIRTSDGNITLELIEKQGKAPVERRARKDIARRAADSSRSQTFTEEGITKLSDSKYVIDQRLYQSLTKDVSSLMTLQRQISFIPKMDEAKNPIGFEIRRITPGSLFQKIGLQRGDVVKSINGRVLNAMSVPEALQLLNDMKDESNINLEYDRNNKNSTIGYEVR